MKVLVTGANGFIGQSILSRLLSDIDKRFEGAGLVRNAASLNLGAEIVKADITDFTEVSSALKNSVFEAVIHCAGLAHQFGDTSKREFENVNVKGTENIARIASEIGCRNFILISSTAVYGTHENEIDESSECRPETVYAQSKLKAEEVCRKICEENKISLTIFRLAPVLGEKGVGNMPKLIEAIDKGKFLWVGKGENKKSLIYVDDIAEACVKILLQKQKGTEIFNLASPPVLMKQIVAAITKELKKSVTRFSVPKFIPQTVFTFNSKTLNLGFINKISKTFEKFLSDDIYSGDKIKKAYGFAPETPVEIALHRQCRWYLEQKPSKN